MVVSVLTTLCFVVVLSQGLKGVGAKVVILEEASRLEKQVFDEVVIPLLGVKDTAVIAISTPLDDTNFYSQMLELKQDDGETPLFNVISISLICDECQGKDLKGQITCPHKQNEIPPWKTQRRQDLVKKLLESNPEMYKREQLGVITKNENNCFPVDKLPAFEQSCGSAEEFVDTLFCCIDPAGGGSSCAAIITGYLYDNRTEVMVRLLHVLSTLGTCRWIVGRRQTRACLHILGRWLRRTWVFRLDPCRGRMLATLLVQTRRATLESGWCRIWRRDAFAAKRCA